MGSYSGSDILTCSRHMLQVRGGEIRIHWGVLDGSTWVTTSGRPCSTNCNTRRLISSRGSCPLSGLPTDSSKQPSVSARPFVLSAADSKPLHKAHFLSGYDDHAGTKSYSELGRSFDCDIVTIQSLCCVCGG